MVGVRQDLRFKQLSPAISPAGAEVQKGDAIEERKIQRLSVMAMSLIKKSNDLEQVVSVAGTDGLDLPFLGNSRLNGNCYS